MKINRLQSIEWSKKTELPQEDFATTIVRKENGEVLNAVFLRTAVALALGVSYGFYTAENGHLTRVDGVKFWIYSPTEPEE